MIGRLNVGGPAIQAITLTKRLQERGYETLLVRGVEGEREGSMDDLAQELGVRPLLVDSLRREIGPHDLIATLRLASIIRARRPQIIHTHAAKAGAVGRLAARLAGNPTPPISVHTFHGHVLSGYFSQRKAAMFRQVERGLALATTRLIAVSDEVRDDLIALSIASPEQIETVPLGFDLTPFSSPAPARSRTASELRTELGIPADATVVTLIARLVPIKRVDRFLTIAARLAARTDAHFLVVGDGELSAVMRSSPHALALRGRLTWAGIQRDMPAVMEASDVVCLTSDNEGTPVSLIEAQAAGRPVVSTDVGGVSSAVLADRSGYLVPAQDPDSFADRVDALIADNSLRTALGLQGRAFVTERFGVERLVDDIDGLYRRLLGAGL